MVGQSLGHYRIEDQLGAGGMGVVYRATDSKLGRQVAIKVLPEKFARDPERLARFEREARLLAALNHPNIAAIHGLEEAGGVHYLVLELVPGETLKAHCRSRKPYESAPRLPRRWKRPTTRGSFTATSSPPTSRSPPRARSRCWTLVWPKRWTPALPRPTCRNPRR